MSGAAVRSPDLEAPVTKLDLLAFAPHPDDAEIGMGGTLAKHAALGFGVGICDLTRGEMGSNGTPEERLAEAREAGTVIGAAWRENLDLPDRALGSSADHARRVAGAIRRLRPRVVAAPYWDDRHPDHGAASRLLSEAVFNAGLLRYRADGEPWRPEWVCYYFINDTGPASFVVDVSEYYEVKRRALACYRSQFQGPAAGRVATRLNTPRFMQLVESRDAQFGALTDVPFAEGFVVRGPIVRPNLFRDLEPSADRGPRSPRT